MDGSFIGYHNQNLVFTANIQVNSPSGFIFHLSKTGQSIYDVVSFSGVSGYIFDQQGNFVGGYRKNEVINFSGNYFYGPHLNSGSLVVDDNSPSRFAYFIKNKLICNGISGQTGYFDTVRFEKYGVNTMNFDYIMETGSPNVLVDSGYFPIESSEGYYLAGS
jgi:hypothetical protein